MWQKEGLAPPQEIQKATMEYRQEMDVIGSFIEECCDVGDGLRVKPNDLYAAYKEWAKDANEHEFKKQTFFTKIIDRFEKTKSNGTRYYLGIDLKKEYRPFDVKVPGL